MHSVTNGKALGRNGDAVASGEARMGGGSRDRHRRRITQRLLPLLAEKPAWAEEKTERPWW